MINEETEEKLRNLIGIAVCLTAIALLMSIGIAQRVSANPYYLNLTTGQFVDLNETNETTLSIAIYNYSYLTITNITWNVTNITNYSSTCYNCTTNITNITNITQSYLNKSYYLNSTNNSMDVYTKAETDAKYLLIGTPYVSVADFQTLINKFNELNYSVNSSISDIKKPSSTTGPWIISILAFILAAGAIYLARRAEGY